MWTLWEAYNFEGVSPSDIWGYDWLCPRCYLGNCFVRLSTTLSLCTECGKVLNSADRAKARQLLTIEDAQTMLMTVEDETGLQIYYADGE